MTRDHKSLPCLNLCLNDSIRKAMFDRLQFFKSLTDFLQTKTILSVFLCSVTCATVIENLFSSSHTFKISLIHKFYFAGLHWTNMTVYVLYIVHASV